MASFLHLARRFLVLGVILFLAAHSAWGQEPDPIAKSLGLTPDQKALPVWTNPKPEDRASLSKVTPKLAQGIFLVGHPSGGFGTAWVLSREHRLLVTNAHVADIRHESGGKMFAIRNDTAGVFYTVKQIWYHPGVRRRVRKLGGVSSLSANPADGAVDAMSPDLAVLQLSVNGPKLPVELPTATPEDVRKLAYQPVGMVGFPGHDTRKWPELDEKAKATYRDGVVSRLTDFRYQTNASREELQFVQHTASSWPGFSGSPVFLTNGRVVAIHNSAIPAQHPKARSVTITIPHGIRVDCLWELLVYHKLDAKVPQEIDASGLNIQRWLKPDQRDKNLQRAMKLVEEAAALMDDQKFSQAIDKCNEANDLVPEYPWAYQVRGTAYLNYYFFEKRAPRNIRGKRLSRALVDALVYSSKMGASDPEAMLFLCAVLVNFGHEFNGFKGPVPPLGALPKGISVELARAISKFIVMAAKQGNDRAFAVSNELLQSDNLTTPQRARAYSFRGSARYNLGEARQALEDHKQATRLDPGNYMLWENRAGVYDALGLRAEARAFRVEAERIRERQKRASQAKKKERP